MDMAKSTDKENLREKNMDAYIGFSFLRGLGGCADLPKL